VQRQEPSGGRTENERLQDRLWQAPEVEPVQAWKIRQSHGRPKGSLKLSTDLAAVTTGRADDSYVDWERPVEQAFRGARITALTSGSTIPDTADYHVVLEPESQVIGSVNEDSTPDFRTYRCGTPLGQPADARRAQTISRSPPCFTGCKSFSAARSPAVRRTGAIIPGATPGQDP
jgi:hypothetical protein